MDYVREELLRQQTALAQLLLGGAPRPGEELPPEGRLTAGRAAGGAGEETAPEDGEAALTREAGETPALWSQAAQRHRDALRQAEQAREAEALDLAAAAAAAAVRQRPFAGGEAVFLPAASIAPAGETPGRAQRALSAQASRHAGAPGGGTDPSAPEGAVPLAGDGGGAGSVQSVVELVRPLAAAPGDAGALSRLFQRDARRYDGGFELY